MFVGRIIESSLHFIIASYQNLNKVAKETNICKENSKNIFVAKES